MKISVPYPAGPSVNATVGGTPLFNWTDRVARPNWVVVNVINPATNTDSVYLKVDFSQEAASSSPLVDSNSPAEIGPIAPGAAGSVKLGPDFTGLSLRATVRSTSGTQPVTWSQTEEQRKGM